MTAPIITLAAAIVTEFGTPEVGTTWSQTFTAERRYRIRKDLESLDDDWHVDVIPADEESELINRAAADVNASIDVAIHKRCNPDDLTTVDPIVNLQEEFRAYWLRRRPATATVQACFRAEKRALWVPQHLEQFRVCTSVIRLTFKTLV